MIHADSGEQPLAKEADHAGETPSGHSKKPTQGET